MTNRKYAQGTDVSVARSRDEIERTLVRFGATGQLWARDDEKNIVTVAFKRETRTYKFTLSMPSTEAFAFTPTKQRRTAASSLQARDAEMRRRFRSLANYIKALLDMTDSGIAKADEVLLPYLLLGTGETVYQRAMRQLQGQAEVDLSHALAAASSQEVKRTERSTGPQ